MLVQRVALGAARPDDLAIWQLVNLFVVFEFTVVIDIAELEVICVYFVTFGYYLTLVLVLSSFRGMNYQFGLVTHKVVIIDGRADFNVLEVVVFFIESFVM